MERFNEMYGMAMYKPCKATLMALAKAAIEADELIDYEFGSWAIEHAYDDKGLYLEVVSPHWDRWRVYYPQGSWLNCGD